MKKIISIMLLLSLFFLSGCTSQGDLDPICYEKGEGEGMCDAVYMGFRYDGEKCIKDYVGGCSGSMPFETIEDCQNICEK